jgi:glycosyltransferase involved in cell wall biosynthesis
MMKPTALLLAHFSGYLLQFRGALITELVTRGYRTVVAVPDLGEGVRTGLIALGAEPVEIAMSRTGLNPLADLAYARRIGRLMRDLRPQLVIATGIKPILHGMPAAKAWGAAIRVPLFAGLGSMIRPESRMHRALAVAVSPLIRRAIRCSTHVVTQNEDDSRLLAARFAAELRCALITTCGSGVDLAHYRMESMRPGKQVLMTSRIVPEKGVAEFFAAAGAVRQLDPDVSFLLAGFLESSTRGLSRAWLDEQCRVTGVRYVGHVEDVRPLIAESLLLVLPSYAEGRPRVVQEALATGRPVVTTDAPGCRDSIIDGVHGRIVPAKNSAALAQAIQEVLHMAQSPRILEICREYAERRYCSTSIARDMLDAINAYQQSGSRGGPM